MTESIPPEVLRKVRKLAQLPDDARQSRLAVSVTRLTVLKSLCQQPELADRFVTYLAHKVLGRVEQGTGHASRPKKAADLVHREMIRPHWLAWRLGNRGRPRIFAEPLGISTSA
jgi:hypothetical protein